MGILMYEIHVQRRRKISMRASDQPSYIDIIVIALLETSVVVGWWRVRVSGGARFQAKGERGRARLGRVEASLCKGDGQLGNPGPSRWPEVVAFGTSCGIVSARLSASNGRAPSQSRIKV